MEKKTLKQLFESQRDVLAQRLEGMKLPKDAEKAQIVVSNYLNELFDGDGEFRQNLTQSEDYILQAAMSLLNAQQSMIAPLAKVEIQQEPNATIEDEPVMGEPIDTANTKSSLDGIAQHIRREQYPMVIGGSAIGSAAGALIMGSWGAVFGAIAGTALVLYASAQSSSAKNAKSSQPKLQVRPQQRPQARMSKIVETPIDTSLFMTIVSNICDSVDSLIATFRAQINRVVDKYESQEKLPIEAEYPALLENIQALLGVAAGDSDPDTRQKRIEKRIEMLADSLENYDLRAVNYDGNNAIYFAMQPSPNVSKDTMVAPALLRGDRVVMKGKVFTKQ